MLTSVLVIVFGGLAVLVAGFVWALCRMAAITDERIDAADPFSRYRVHVNDCDECDPPDKRCPVGVALRHEAIETFTEKQAEARANGT